MIRIRFGSAAVETLIVRLVKDAASGISQTPVGTRVHKSPVPDSLTYPFLTFFKRNARSLGPIGSNVPAVAEILTYEIKGVDVGYSTHRIEDAASLLDVALDGHSFTVEVDGTLYHVSVNRVSELQVELPPEDDGTVFQHIGGIYDFFVTLTDG